MEVRGKSGRVTNVVDSLPQPNNTKVFTIFNNTSATIEWWLVVFGGVTVMATMASKCCNHAN